MPAIEAFRGLRYNLGQVGSLSDVVAPPYDVIDGALQNELYQRHPANVVRLILNRQEPGDRDPMERYQRAARFYRNWRSEGVLELEPVPCVYVYHQRFDHQGVTRTRRGFVARVRLEPFGQGTIFPHEQTHEAAKQDRLHLMRATRANLSQVFGLYPDLDNTAQELLETAIIGQTPLEATDHLGVVHRLWPLGDLGVISQLASLMSAKPVFIADGHHRYETACKFRDELNTAGDLPADHAANYVLMMCVAMSDPGMVVLPTHRLFRGLAPITSAELIARLGKLFSIRVAGHGKELATDLWDQIESDRQQGTIGLYAGRDEKWLVARISRSGRARMRQLAPEHGSDWQGLGVSILHRLLLPTLAGDCHLPEPMYVHTVQEVIHHLGTGDVSGRDSTGQLGTGGPFPLAALVMPATLEYIQSISQNGERMPAKSTYFYPKLLSGLVISPLE
jgi:uncharacterized protein (DUF1015 family)